MSTHNDTINRIVAAALQGSRGVERRFLRHLVQEMALRDTNLTLDALDAAVSLTHDDVRREVEAAERRATDDEW